MENLIEKRKKIAYRLRYASRQGWATELLEKEFEEIKNEIILIIKTEQEWKHRTSLYREKLRV